LSTRASIHVSRERFASSKDRRSLVELVALVLELRDLAQFAAHRLLSVITSAIITAPPSHTCKCKQDGARTAAADCKSTNKQQEIVAALLRISLE
jgi:hypothetical protein